MPHRIGIGVITCNRPTLFQQCIDNLPSADKVIVINDGREYSNALYHSKVTQVIQHKKNKGIGPSKNEALKYLLNEQCQHIFLSEDDVSVRDENVCERYIRLSEASGIKHFNYGLHGPFNKDDGGNPVARKVITYGVGIEGAFYRFPLAAFSYYDREVLEVAGLIDEFYRNIHEHVDHTVRIIQAGYHPPYGWFADLAHSDRYILDLDPQWTKSTHRQSRLRYLLRYYGYFAYYIARNGYPHVATDQEFDEWRRGRKLVGEVAQGKPVR